MAGRHPFPGREAPRPWAHRRRRAASRASTPRAATSANAVEATITDRGKRREATARRYRRDRSRRQSPGRAVGHVVRAEGDCHTGARRVGASPPCDAPTPISSTPRSGPTVRRFRRGAGDGAGSMEADTRWSGVSGGCPPASIVAASGASGLPWADPSESRLAPTRYERQRRSGGARGWGCREAGPRAGAASVAVHAASWWRGSSR